MSIRKKSVHSFNKRKRKTTSRRESRYSRSSSSKKFFIDGHHIEIEIEDGKMLADPDDLPMIKKYVKRQKTIKPYNDLIEPFEIFDAYIKQGEEKQLRRAIMEANEKYIIPKGTSELLLEMLDSIDIQPNQFTGLNDFLYYIYSERMSDDEYEDFLREEANISDSIDMDLYGVDTDNLKPIERSHALRNREQLETVNSYSDAGTVFDDEDIMEEARFLAQLDSIEETNEKLLQKPDDDNEILDSFEETREEIGDKEPEDLLDYTFLSKETEERIRDIIETMDDEEKVDVTNLLEDLEEDDDSVDAFMTDPDVDRDMEDVDIEGKERVELMGGLNTELVAGVDRDIQKAGGETTIRVDIGGGGSIPDHLYDTVEDMLRDKYTKFEDRGFIFDIDHNHSKVYVLEEGVTEDEFREKRLKQFTSKNAD